MNSKPLVSVITPFFNAKKFLRESIESVFAQEYENWELLLVDDGSTDGSTEIALEYAQQNPLMVGYREHEDHANRGISATRNLGLRHARGQYVTFLDSDDVYLSHKLEHQVQILNCHPEAAAVYGSTLSWYSWTENPEDRQLDYEPDLGVPTNKLFEPPSLLAHFILHPEATPCTCSLLIRREIIGLSGGFEESFCYAYEDQAFYMKLALVASMFVADGTSARYRQHPDSCCHVIENTERQRSERISFLSWVEKYLTQQSVTDPVIWGAMETAFKEMGVTMPGAASTIADG